MKKLYSTSLFIFRRDLRLEDNTALIACTQQSSLIVPIFIYDSRQVTHKNTFKSENAVQFMRESLNDLKKTIKARDGNLYEFYGIAEKVLDDLLKKNKIDAVFFNKDYTPFAHNRDKNITKTCKNHHIPLFTFDDVLLNQPHTIFTQKRTPFLIFGAFFRQARKITISKPKKLSKFTFYTGTIKSSFANKTFTHKENKNIEVHGGTTHAKKILKNLKKFVNYKRERDFPALATTHLAAHLKFGTVSVRTAYHEITKKLGPYHELIKQLYWRDFFTYLVYHHPHVFQSSFKPAYEHIAWNNNKTLFDLWCSGTTGFPLVDAGMRELNTTGFMHNRIRMIVGSFLTKDLLINWQWGEQYFASKLVDYDPAVNNGNWQWVASTGADAQPYFRIFNPWTQQKKFDAQCVYIKKWLPELARVPVKNIHTWYNSYKQFNIKNYPAPIVDHDIQRKKALRMYTRYT